jgi:hypothetical protein
MTLRWVQATRSSGLRESGEIGMPTAAPLAVAPNPKPYTPVTLLFVLLVLLGLGCSKSRTISMSFVLKSKSVSELKKGQILRLNCIVDPAADAYSADFYLSRQQDQNIFVPRNFSGEGHSVEVIEIKDTSGKILYNRGGINELDCSFGGEDVNGKHSYQILFYKP